MSLKKINRLSVIIFLMGILSVCFLSPKVERTLGDMKIFALIGFTLLLERSYLFKADNKAKKNIIYISLYIGMLFIYKFLGVSVTSVSYHFNIVRFFLLYICMIPLYNKLNSRQVHFLLMTSFLAAVYTIFDNFHLKKLYGRGYTQRLYTNHGIKGVVNTQYTSAILIISGCLFVAFLHEKRLKYKILYAGSTGLCVLFNLLVTQRGIPVVLTAVMLPLLLLFNSDIRNKKTVLKIVLFLLLATVIIFKLNDILSWASTVIGSERLASRLNTLSEYVEGGSGDDVDDSTMGNRLRLIGLSIKTFLSTPVNFLLGAGHRLGDNTVVGNHSQLIDEFARFGIFGGLLSVLTLYNILRKIQTDIMDKGEFIISSQFLVIYIIFIIRAFIGTAYDTSIGAAMFLVMPLIFKTLLEVKKRGNSE